METAHKFVASITTSQVPAFITDWLFSSWGIIFLIILVAIIAGYFLIISLK